MASPGSQQSKRCICPAPRAGARMLLRDCPVHFLEVWEVIPWVPLVIKPETAALTGKDTR